MRSRSVTLMLCVIALAAPPSQAGASESPQSMAALGDSLTVGVGAGTGGSWSTGTRTDVDSHFLRLKAGVPGITVANYAVSGKKVSALEGQAKQAVAMGAEYVTTLIGTNDVCRSDAITATQTFREQFKNAMDTLAAGPATRIFVASIPDPGRLRELFAGNQAAEAAWVRDSRCPRFLSGSVSGSERSAAQQRRGELNGQLAEVCTLARPRCIFDGNAVASWKFQAEHVATKDYFHFSVKGQAELARLTFPLAFPATQPPSPPSTPPPPPSPPPPPPTSSACDLAQTFNGSLSRTGATAFKPGSSFKTTTTGTHKGCLRGPRGADFDLYLDQRVGSLWSPVAQSTTRASSSEDVTYPNAAAGIYRWRIVSFSGSGAYTFSLTKPA